VGATRAGCRAKHESCYRLPAVNYLLISPF
jgi:hypothetical protein